MPDSKFTNVKAVFFDTSDTLYTNIELEQAYPDSLISMIAKSKDISVAEADKLLKVTTDKLKSTEKHVTKIRAAKELGFSADYVYKEAFDLVDPTDYLTVDANLSDLLTQLSRSYKLGVISNLKRTHVDKVLSALGIADDVFSYLVTLDVVKDIKPSHEPFTKAIELSGYSADDCLYIGDSPTKDMLPAKEVGMKTILINTTNDAEDLKNADQSIANILELENILL